MQFQDTKVKIATRKACNTQNIPPKQKHVRTIIIKSYTGGIPTFISEISKTLQSSNMIQQYKSINTLQRVLIEGSDEILIHYLQILLSLFNKIINTPPTFHKNDIFRKINKHYLQYMQLRLIFHQKNPSIHSNLTLPNQQNIPEEYYSDQKCLTTISYAMDLMDYLLVLPLPLIQQYPNDTCKLDCCIPLIQDSFVLYNNIIFFMTNLAHIDQYQSVFNFLYDRLKKLYTKLNQLYLAARQNYYISMMIDIPYLPALPEFKISEEEKKKYMKQHPHSYSKQSQMNDKNQMKMKQQEKERNQLVTFGKSLNTINQELIQELVPSSIQSEDQEYRFVQFVNQFESQMDSLSNQQLQQAMWVIIKESKNILHDENIEYVVSNNSKENVINLLYSYQHQLNDWKSFGIDNQMKQIELQNINNQIEEFINSLISYVPPQQKSLSSMMLFDWDSFANDYNQNHFENKNNEFAFNDEDQFEFDNHNDFEMEPEMKESKEIKHQESEEENDLQQYQNVINEIQQMNEIIESIQSKHTQPENQNETNEFIIQFEDISKEVIELIKCSEHCEKERIKNGKQQSTNLYYQNETWKEGLLSCAKRIVEWIQYISNCIMNDIYDERILVALKQFKSLCSQLVSAAKVSMNENSTSLHELEDITLNLKKKIEQLINDILSSQSQNQMKENEIKEKEIKSDGIQSKKHLMESEIKVLQLQRELEHAQQQLYSLRKKEYQ